MKNVIIEIDENIVVKHTLVVEVEDENEDEVHNLLSEIDMHDIRDIEKVVGFFDGIRPLSFSTDEISDKTESYIKGRC